ncbi:hypothetical protein F966_03244 [Acinetobacter higginsii]|uniref:Uncharacterized protein n=1 Tax=Acinetobacter higginsii TaxID=70347 RepID=N8XNE5_9GAMM|nr:hypothetical protein [Acinetobacter higginsii]ENV08570.1 hypothetical protein F966_03244 [Acinetobacter higginsii]
MKRIDSVNARPNANGTGKSGFHDNSDISGQDATYLTPDWLNQVQEELCNLLEKNGKPLDPNQRDQLYQLLSTEADIMDLATAVQQKIDAEKLEREKADGIEADARAASDNLLANRIKALELAPPPLGVGQQWVNVKDSRVTGTPYQNPFNRPIAVSITVQVYHGSAPAQLVLDGLAKAEVKCDVGPNGYIVSQLYIVLPVGSEYMLSNADAVIYWEELKQID